MDIRFFDTDIVSLKTHFIFFAPHIRHVDSHIPKVADRTPRIGSAQSFGDFKRGPHPAAHQQRKNAKFIVVQVKFLTFVLHSG